ncbi:fc10bd08-5de6-46f2-81e3-354333392e8f [Thermothielavioides terrestris]|jgi:uncharacterized protein YbjT (DUF2867 family)|uniref:NmrA-like domain-containing protein n=2 Tax=Thermothielavioides terrestris TaxID=2587410 RepID=G2R0I2_THETT|nr:uncharacterized protein THITE_2114557 [Thermothielavioides terrestris NRRL 8126]AEO66450.1 hypothetical protein THITE_2114557 [Thermothielavioides terrestris NRRL 8126]SPQ20318.1 fc10bd08-5de6-46f2-81e3-354333392e8f [Thermothielavioides terrestris]
MSQLLVVLGATGQQGGSVANFVLSDPALSARYKVRGVTRDPSKPAAEALKAKGAEVVEGDLDNPESLKTALAGADTVFITTRTIYDDQTKEREVRQGKAAADAAVAGGAKYIIYSTEVHCEVISNGKYRVAAYDSRAEVEAYIRSLPVKSAFFAPGSFMQNFAGAMGPRPVADQPGVYAISSILPGDAPAPWIDAAADTGKFVGAILADPDRFAGQTLWAASEVLSYNQVAAKISAATGKTVNYVALPEATFRAYLPPAMQEPLVGMFNFIAEYGYYGPESERKVKETLALVPYKLTSFDEWIAANIRLA